MLQVQVSDLGLLVECTLDHLGHSVEGHYTCGRTDRHDLHLRELVGNRHEVLLVLSCLDDVAGHNGSVLEHRNDALWLVSWSQADIAEAENVFVYDWRSWLANFSQRVLVGHLAEFVNENLSCLSVKAFDQEPLHEFSWTPEFETGALEDVIVGVVASGNGNLGSVEVIGV